MEKDRPKIDSTRASGRVPATTVRPQRLAVSRHGMVATAHHSATEAAVEILEDGGNAIDAAVASAFALGVCEPAASGLGGQTMMLVHIAEERRTFALDGSSRAPNRATPKSLSTAELRRGYRATTVPSTPAVLRYALERYGRLKRKQVLTPAIRLAEEGSEITGLQRRLLLREAKALRKGNAASIFLQRGEKAYPVGARFCQPALAATLRRMAKSGVKSFYSGRIARLIHEDMIKNDGLIRRDDLAQVPRPIERRPISVRFGDWRVVTFPPPGAGRTLIEMINIVSQYRGGTLRLDSAEGSIAMAEIIRRAFIDRRDRPFDPNYYPQVQARRMLSQDYASLVARQIRRRIQSGGETTHLSIMDRAGNVVALTQSIERVFGACVATPDLGFLYNNYMCDFEYEDISHPYYLRPNAVPWASVAPTIVFWGRRPWLAIGSPGSERIAPSILQVLLRLREGMAPLDVVTAPRIHCSLGGRVSLEASRMRSDIPARLERLGYEVDVREPFSFHLGCVQMVLRDRKEFVGVADPRRDGSAGGPSR